MFYLHHLPLYNVQPATTNTFVNISYIYMSTELSFYWYSDIPRLFGQIGFELNRYAKFTVLNL